MNPIQWIIYWSFNSHAIWKQHNSKHNLSHHQQLIHHLNSRHTIISLGIQPTNYTLPTQNSLLHQQLTYELFPTTNYTFSIQFNAQNYTLSTKFQLWWNGTIILWNFYEFIGVLENDFLCDGNERAHIDNMYITSQPPCNNLRLLLNCSKTTKSV